MSIDLFDDPDLDRVLASGLSALAPEIEAIDVTLAELRPRFHRARTRRRVVRASAAIAALLVVGSAAFAEAPSARHSHVTIEAPDRRIAPTTLPKRTHTSASVPRHHTTTTKPATLPATNPPPASSAPGTSGAPQHVVVPQSPTSGAPAPTHTAAPPATTPAPVSVRYRSSGGSIAVRFANGRMALTGVYPAKGYREDLRANTAQRIDVQFTRHGRLASEIALKVINGHVVRTDSSDGGYDSWVSRGISSVSPPGHRALSRPPHSSPRAPEGHGGTRLLGIRTALSQRLPRVEVAHGRRAGKHGTPRHPVVPVDE
jgi:hypothetical protein